MIIVQKIITSKKFYLGILLLLILIFTVSCFYDNYIVFDTSVRPTYSPDGNAILFAPKIKKRQEIILYHLKANKAELLTPINLQNDEECRGPVFSHKGDKIAFVKRNNIKDNNEICIMDGTGGEYTQITYSNHYNFEPVFSKDDKTIYFLRSLKLKNETTGLWIYSIDIETRVEKKITEGYFMVYNFTCSNDNEYLIYSTDYSLVKYGDRNQHIVKFDIETRKEEILLDDKMNVVPCLSSDNKKIIMWAKNFNEKQYKDPNEKDLGRLVGFYSMNIDGSDFTFLKRASLSDYYLTRNFDDKRFLFIDNGLKEYNIGTNEIRKIVFNLKEIYKVLK